MVQQSRSLLLQVTASGARPVLHLLVSTCLLHALCLWLTHVLRGRSRRLQSAAVSHQSSGQSPLNVCAALQLISRLVPNNMRRSLTDHSVNVHPRGYTQCGWHALVSPLLIVMHGMQVASIYLLGGGSCKEESMWLDKVDVFSPSSRACTPAPPLPKPCAYGSAVTIGQRLFYVGGGNGEDWFNSMLRLRLDEGSWEAVSAVSNLLHVHAK